MALQEFGVARLRPVVGLVRARAQAIKAGNAARFGLEVHPERVGNPTPNDLRGGYSFLRGDLLEHRAVRGVEHQMIRLAVAFRP